MDQRCVLWNVNGRHFMEGEGRKRNKNPFLWSLRQSRWLQRKLSAVKLFLDVINFLNFSFFWTIKNIFYFTRRRTSNLVNCFYFLFRAAAIVSLFDNAFAWSFFVSDFIMLAKKFNIQEAKCVFNISETYRGLFAIWERGKIRNSALLRIHKTCAREIFLGLFPSTR